jgi:hypothetical protein
VTALLNSMNCTTLDARFGCVNFHVKQYKGGGARITFTMKNKWVAGWMKAWFYCKVLVHVSRQGGKSVHALRSHMSALEFLMEPLVNCLDTDLADVAFIKATSVIRGRDAVEYLSCILYPLLVSLGLREVADGIMSVLKFKVLVPKFHAIRSDKEDDVKFLVRVELEAKNVVGSYGHTEHDARIKCLLKGSRVNRVFEFAGFPYGPRP